MWHRLQVSGMASGSKAVQSMYCIATMSTDATEYGQSKPSTLIKPGHIAARELACGDVRIASLSKRVRISDALKCAAAD